MTPHINAKENAFAPVVIMPGDPLRAKVIAETFFEEFERVTDVRNMLGYTGTYKGKRISVMGSGMGIPSIAIYATELYKQYGVESIIRAGSCGSIQTDINVGDMVIGMGASTDSTVNRARLLGYDFAAIANFDLLQQAVKSAEQMNLPVRVGNVMSSDLFYRPNPSEFEVMANMGILAVEMEAAGLYGVAAACGKKALSIFTVSDHILKGELLSSAERQNTFLSMMALVLETGIQCL